MSIVIEVDDVWKKYRLGIIGTGTLRHDFERWWHRVRGKPDPHSKVDQRSEIRNRKSELTTNVDHRISGVSASLADDEMWALRGVSFEVKQGEILGIIGSNGAGKSTLLKILSRVTAPTKGEVRIKGRIASLLEVGTGFHPELTGRENIFLNGAILGMRKAEIRTKLDEIVAFAEIDTYVDTPVKRYSSGMYVRLAFAVAAHLDPEILIVDEVLAVGDAEFQKKCLGKMDSVARAGRTVLFVSHSINAITTLCTQALVLKIGRLAFVGGVTSALTEYGAATEVADVTEFSSEGLDSNLRRMTMFNNSANPPGVVNPLDEVMFEIEFHARALLEKPQIGIALTNFKGDRVFAVGSWLGPEQLPAIKGARTVRIAFTMPPIVPGRYTLDVGLYDTDTQTNEEYYAAGAVEVPEINFLGMRYPVAAAKLGSIYVRSKCTIV
jgi:homopolymeric O-antigen transport system ATP-binding protein